MAAPFPILSSSSLPSLPLLQCPGAKIIGTVGGIAAFSSARVGEADVFVAAAYVHAVPLATTGIAQAARHAWVQAFAFDLARAFAHPNADDPLASGAGDVGGGTSETRAIASARTLEQSIYARARQGRALQAALVPTSADRRHAEAVVYNDECRRMQAALAHNSIYLVATYADVTLLPLLDNAHLEVGTAAAAFRERKQHAALLARRVLEDDGGVKTKKVVEGALRCRACRSYDTEYNMNQGRSRDEGMDVLWVCNKCGKGGIIHS